MPKTPRNVALIGLVLFGFLNFFSFLTASIFLGGDAINGWMEAGRYFLMAHGRLHEVSKAVFTYSWWHAWSVHLSHPIAILAGWLLLLDMRRGYR